MTGHSRRSALLCAVATTALALCFDAAGAEPPLSPDTPLARVTFVAFDTETTGLAADRERVVEIAALKFGMGRPPEHRCWLINPGIPIPPSAERIHGISDAMVSNAPPFADVFPPFAGFTEGCVLVAHNAPFDRRFVAAELRRLGLTAPSTPLIDSLPLFKTWFPDQPSYTLSSLSKRLLPPPDPGSPSSNDRTNRFHAAGWDAHCLMDLFLKGAASLPANATLGDILRVTGGAWSFRDAQRLWKPTAAHSSSEDSSASPAP